MDRKHGSKNLAEMLKSKIIDLIRTGMMQSYVSNFYNVVLNTIRSSIKLNNASGNNLIIKQGRKQKQKPRCVRQLINYVQSNNREPLFIVAGRFRTLDCSKLSQHAIRRCLHKRGNRTYFPASYPFFNCETHHYSAMLVRNTEKMDGAVVEKCFIHR